MLVEAFFSTLVSFCLVQLLHNTENSWCFLTALFIFRGLIKYNNLRIPLAF